LADFEKLYKSDASGRHPVEQDKEMRDVLEVLDKGMLCREREVERERERERGRERGRERRRDGERVCVVLNERERERERVCV
jgi:hypothetical protein